MDSWHVAVQCSVPERCHVRENHTLERPCQQHVDTETSESQLGNRLATMFTMCRRDAGRALVAQLDDAGSGSAEIMPTVVVGERGEPRRRDAPDRSRGGGTTHVVPRLLQGSREILRGVPEGSRDCIKLR